MSITSLICHLFAVFSPSDKRSNTHKSPRAYEMSDADYRDYKANLEGANYDRDRASGLYDKNGKRRYWW